MSDLFKYKKPTEESIKKIHEVREACRVLNDVLEKNVSYERMGKVAFQKLEEVSMWANKSIVFNQNEGEN